ncbi:MAG: response regulator [Actinomycetota bacterium]|nr:response regulator [Actinomycetota bacterium]
MTKVLVVDDSHVLRRLVEIALEPLGLDVYTASSAADAKDVIESVVPDVVLLDVGLPDENGIGVLKWVRHDPRYDGVAVVMASGYARTEEIDEATAEGAVGYLIKPYSLDDVRSVVLEFAPTSGRVTG